MNKKRVTIHMPCILNLGRYWTSLTRNKKIELPKSGFDIKRRLSFLGTEEMVLEDFQNYMMSRDPDILVGTANVADRTVIQYVYRSERT